jgi:MFS family permease
MAMIGGRERATSIVALLGLTQIIGYGTTYYCFAILAAGITAEFGISQATYYGLLSLAFVLSGFVAPAIGRIFDRFGAARVMAIGSLLSAAGLAALAVAPSVVHFAGALVFTQVCACLVLYEAAFTALVQLSPEQGPRRIMYLTLIAGFASSVFWPLTNVLEGGIGWRWTMAAYALANLAICLPCHLLVARWCAPHLANRRPAAAQPDERAEAPPHSEGTLRRLMVLVTAGFAISSLALSAVLAQMVPMLQALGFGASSLAVSILFGPAQVIVRFTNLLFGKSQHPLHVTVFALALLPLGFVVAAAFAPQHVAAIVFVVFVGMASGLKSIVQGSLPLALFGAANYGARLGRIASARYILAALAPFIFAVLQDHMTATAAAWIFAGIGLVGVGCFVEVARILRNAPRPPSP